jgi:hypothetical protein
MAPSASPLASPVGDATRFDLRLPMKASTVTRMLAHVLLLSTLVLRVGGSNRVRSGSGLHTTEILAEHPSALDVAIVMMDNRHFQPAGASHLC